MQPLSESNQRLANDIIYKLNNPHVKFDYATVTHINKVLSLLAFSRLDKLKELTIGDLRNDSTVKKELILALGETVQYRFENGLITEEQYNNVMDNIMDDLDESNSVLWNNFVNHFSALYNISIIDESSISSEKEFEDIPIWWDDKQQLKFNVLTSIQSKVKFKLSSLSNGVNDITGLPEVVDLNIIINRLINTHRFDTTDNQFLDSLSNLSKTYPAINALINEFAKRDESGEGWEITDVNYFNAYKSALNYDMAHVSATIINQVQGFTVFDNLVSNRYSFIENVDFDTWGENIKINLSNDNLKGLYNQISDYIKGGNISKISYFKLDKFLNINLDNSTNFFEQLSALLFSLGITITSDSMQSIYDSAEYEALGDNKKKTIYFNLVLPTERLLVELYTLIDNKKTKYISNEKGNLYKLAKFNATKSNTATQLDYLNVENENVYTPIYQSYVSKHFTNMSSIVDVRRNFEKFTKDAKFKYSNWLWNIGGNGIFNYDEVIFAKTGEYVIDESNPVNLTYTSELNPTFFNGIKLAEDATGLEYSKIVGRAWDITCLLNAIKYDKNSESILLNGTYYIPSSDSARIVGVPLKYITGDIVIVEEKASKPGTNTDYIKAVSYDSETRTWKLRNGSTLHTQVVNTIMQELIDMRRTANRVFDISTSGSLSVKSEFNDAIGLAKLSSPKDWNGKALLVDGKPTGSVFKFSNLTYVVKENGVDRVVTLNELFSDYSYLTEDVNSPYIQTKINEFVAKAISANIAKTITAFKFSMPILMKYARYGIEGGKTKASKLTKEQLKENALFKNGDELSQTIAEYYVTNYIAQVEFGNFINGNINEYKDTLDANKRIGQSIKNGLGTNSNRTYKSLVISDVYVNSPIYDVVKQLSPKHAEQYRNDKGATNSTDAFTFIRLKEGINRAKDFGRYDSYKDVYEDATNPDVIFTPEKYDRLNESHKYFMYGRELDTKLDSTNPRIKSVQDKNSTMVLTPNSVRGTQLEDILNWMDANDIDELVFDSANKVGGDRRVKIFDENGYFVEPNTKEVNEAIAIKKVSNLVVQLDVVPHITDEVNKVGVQLEKQILNNIKFNDAVYQVYGKDSKLTGNQLKEAYQEVMNADIVELANDLLREFDAIENGEVKTTVVQGQTIIDINNEKVIKFLQDYVRKNETSEILLKAIDDIVKGQTNLPIYSGLTVTKFTNILNALFTNNVINRKIKGAHLSIIPDVGYNPSRKYITDGEIDFDSYFKECAIKYTNEFKERCKTNKSVKLGVEKVPINGEDVYYVDTVIAPWETRFYDENGMIDINKLDDEARTMFGIRIPTEGKQSMVVARVVGFLPGGSSQCIMPDFLVTKTGWDFDIDSIYLYFKELELVDGKYTPIKFNDDTKNKEQYKKYINSTKFAANERLKFANRFNAIYKQIEENRNNYLNNPDVTKASIFAS